ncbi:MAG TPA: peptidoglycan DD-metalloendopeptidase family protein [Methylomirabilota bacterium]|jgi:murein DD-endopeptidase MepM/ murein hydrolase activator NlpD|nr:peptidoglycan DD-metalloendopeptidase family protein [Methylomirabilota bacterium]HEV8617257.1 peptidoglycan DD-metalloendopeptidase family protein [Methylomirabilota bacterium]
MRQRLLLLVLLGACAVWLSSSSVVDHDRLRRVVAVEQAAEPVSAPATVVAAPEPAPARTSRPVTVRRGDTLVSALARQGIGRRVSNDIATALASNGADLRKLNARDALEVTWTLEGEPIALNWEPSPWLGFAVIANAGTWEVRRSETRPDVRAEVVSGEVASSLFEAVEAKGESAQLVLEMVEIFSSDFDFTADTRRGDRFRLLVEKRYAGDAFVDYGRILAAQYVSDGGVLTGIGFEAGPDGRHAYYDTGGRSLKKSFLKSPLEFTRITSGFTYARPHPILGGTRPHLAIDYGAPVGTPVRAVADGAVIAAGWNGGNGISITLRHRSGYQTMYNHLSRLGAGIRSGARVSQRQVIGYVGSTGLSTGPHLDYRVAHNGRFVNPLGEKFIPGEPIAGAERARFQQHSRALVRQLEQSAPF